MKCLRTTRLCDLWLIWHHVPDIPEKTGHWASAPWAPRLFVRTFTHQRMTVCKHTVNAVMSHPWFPLYQNGSKGNRRPQSCTPDVVSNTSRHQIYRHWDRDTDSLGTILKIKTFKNSEFDSLEKRIKTKKNEFKSNGWVKVKKKESRT